MIQAQDHLRTRQTKEKENWCGLNPMMVQSLFKADVANSNNVIVSPAFNFGIPVDACVTVAKALHSARG